MPPQLVLLGCLVFIFYLFRRDYKLEKAETGQTISAATWIPTIWLLILGSRSVSQWLNMQSGQGEAEQLMEGSPTDLLVFSFLLVAALFVIAKRKIRWGDLVRNNPWLVMFFLFCAVSILWADFPFVSFKKWIKGLGDPLMALILLSDPMPGKAVERVLKRCAYVLIPLSIVFMKYFPGIGRAYSFWTGAAYYTGVALNKNQLGYLLFVFGLYFLSALLGRGAKERFAGKRGDLAITIAFVAMVFYLFRMSDSKTPLMTMILGCLVVLALRFSFVRSHLFALILCGVVFQMVVPVKDLVIASAGRDSTLTGRTDVWDSVLRLRVNDLVGAGFESFWTGDRLMALWAEFPFRPTQAHNGYLEIFLNLGAIGFVIWMGVLCTTFRRMRKKVVSFAGTTEKANYTDELIFAIYGMAYLLGFLLYNWTEANFKPLNFLFVVFLTLLIEYPQHAVDDRPLASGLKPGARVPRSKQPPRVAVPA